ncbi:hypothetical protein Rmet_5218 (plasmid) [Cupriavidus metallidurans CH34]|uniref:Uncharacterized protein n=1 Tax=Cupriavidus metallidurans (strain ATCC 43123 / DSM 2839 / NBRC 102507 / CH34) TaxID=266264 RepID=Q1LCP9_CUPMC|nr:hypothetical protein Rmet_5218 [Cupriavidus metallidurans CH34]
MCLRRQIRGGGGAECRRDWRLPLDNYAEKYQAVLLQYLPGSTCTSGDGWAVHSLGLTTRKAWLARAAPASGRTALLLDHKIP